MPSLLGIALSRCLIELNVDLLPSVLLKISNEQMGCLLFVLYMVNMHLFVYESVPVITKVN